MLQLCLSPRSAAPTAMIRDLMLLTNCVQPFSAFSPRIACALPILQVRDTNAMVEEMMLLANCAVAAKTLAAFPSCSLLRRHQVPAPKQFEPLLKAAAAAGFTLDISDSKVRQETASIRLTLEIRLLKQGKVRLLHSAVPCHAVTHCCCTRSSLDAVARWADRAVADMPQLMRRCKPSVALMTRPT